MNSNSVGTDLFNNQLKVESQTSSLSPEQNAAVDSYKESTAQPVKNEVSVFTQKSLISFGVMFVSLVLIIVLLVAIKKKLNIQNNSEPVGLAGSFRKKKNKQKSSLTTPDTIEDCIRSFLENTKRN